MKLLVDVAAYLGLAVSWFALSEGAVGAALRRRPRVIIGFFVLGVAGMALSATMIGVF